MEPKTENESKSLSSEETDDLLKGYYKHLSNLEIETRERGTPLQHAKWMLLFAQSIEDNDRKNRWLGFIQGVLFMSGVFSIDECRCHVRERKV